MKKRAVFPLLLVFVLALSLSGCSSGYSSGSKSTEQNTYAPMTAAETAAAAYDLGFDGAYPEETKAMAAPMAAAGEAAKAEEEEGGDTAAQAIAQNTASSLPLERKLIRTMNLEVETTSFDELIQSIQKKTASLQGYIEQSDISGNSIASQGRLSKKYASMVLRIPADNLNSFISQVESEGNVTYKSENVNDVTLQYSDTESRLKTLRMEQERLWELLAKADTTEAIILLEERLTEVSSEIESSEARLRHLSNSVSYSTVYLSLLEVDIESPTQPETAWQQIQRGFTRNVIDLMDALTQFFIGFLSHIPVILFIVILVWIVVSVFKKVWKYHQKKKASALSYSDTGTIWKKKGLKQSHSSQSEKTNPDSTNAVSQDKESSDLSDQD